MSISKEEISRIRKLLGLSQVELGKILGVSNTTVSNWETGVHSMGVAEACVLRSLLAEKQGLSMENKKEIPKTDSNDELIKELLELQRKYIKKLEDELDDVKKQNIFPFTAKPTKDKKSGNEGD